MNHDTLSWVTANLATISLLFMSQEVYTILGNIVSWIGILALAVFNLVKAYIAFRASMRENKATKDGTTGNTES
jgi:hypothetical protein